MRCVFFFFKQKTAYELRISDWSSDVCSSDLVRPRRRAPPCKAVAGAHVGARWPKPETGIRYETGQCRQRPKHPEPPHRHEGPHSPSVRSAARTTDRKSVVSGKSVSVRVDLGGSRLIKKNTYATYSSLPHDKFVHFIHFY